MLFSEIVPVVNGTLEKSPHDEPIQELIIDTRSITNGNGSVFFCIKGPQHDGHKFIQQAFDKGIRNFIISAPLDLPEEANVIKVADTLKSFQDLAGFRRSSYQYPVIGITGSNGKTMIKEWLSTILQQKYEVVKSPKSYNSQVGVPLSVWQMNEAYNMAVFEAGISKPGEMENLQKIIQPTLGIFTNIGEAHSEGFSSIEEKVFEKSRLFAGSDIIICNVNHKSIYPFLKKTFKEKLVSWGESGSPNLKISNDRDVFTFTFQGKSWKLTIRERGTQNLENIFHAVSAAILFGLSEEEIQRGLANIVAVPMRLELKRGLNDTYLLDDTYNNDIAGLKIALDYQQQQSQYSHKTVILSDILQSGKNDSALYGEVNELLLSHQVSRIIGIGPNISAHGVLFSMDKKFFLNTEEFLSDDLAFTNQMILIKGARKFGLEKIVAFLEEKNHGTVLEINFEALTHNLNTYKKRLHPKTKLMAMVKAFAYGGGIGEIANHLQYQKVDQLGVAYVDEGIYLRKHGIKLPILVLNPNWDSLSLLSSFDLEAEVYSMPMLVHMLNTLDKLPNIHLKIETGMFRLGLQEEDIDELINIIRLNPQIKITGILTHLSSQEESANDDYTRNQIKTFIDISERLTNVLKIKPTGHVLNSAGIIRWPNYQMDMVRLGVGLYGFDSSETIQDLRPISHLTTKISQIKSIKKGDTIGYSRKGKAKKDGKIAILPIGYADGYLRVFGNGNAYVIINGQKAKTIGNICMDMTMVDVTNLKVVTGDTVTIFGDSPTISDLAKWANTIPYEILTNISQRVKRVFRSE